MGVTLTKQQLDKFKSERIDKIQLDKCIKSIKTQEDIEAAIKQFLAIMTIREKIGQLQQISCGD